MRRWLLIAAFVLLPLAGGAQPRQAGPADPLLAMPPELQRQFVHRVMRGHDAPRARLERIVDFVFDRRGLGMVYAEAATHTVAESFATRQANCLGFTLLFVALARAAGLDAFAQVYEQTLAWRQTAGTFYRSSHVNAVVRIGSRRYSLDVARDAVITRGQPMALSERQWVVRYHNNLAVEALERGDLPAARRHMTQALEGEPTAASHWSNSGVLALRGGDARAARQAYAKALALDADHADALFNMVGLAHREGDVAQEAQLRARLARVQQRDPFHHFLQATDFERAGDLAQAIEHYRLAIRLYRTDGRFHAALAAALEKRGDIESARVSWERAVSRSRGATREAYQARLRALDVR